MRNDILLQVESLIERVKGIYPECSLEGENVDEIFNLSKEESASIAKLSDLICFIYREPHEQLIQLLKLLKTGHDPAIVVLLSHLCGFKYAAMNMKVRFVDSE